MWVRDTPNTHEKELFRRAEKYIARIAWIPGLEMVAVVNSLSMFATHQDSDIDLFIITKPGTLWFVRFFVTLVFSLLWVWRHSEDIAGNFCLSFFATTDAMNMENIAIENDIYLYYWIYYMKPIFARDNIYERFLADNTWTQLDATQKLKNKTYIKLQKPTQKSYKIFEYTDRVIRYVLLPRTLKNYERLWKPTGVVVSDNMLKFHDQDRRVEIRDEILKKNFDK